MKRTIPIWAALFSVMALIAGVLMLSTSTVTAQDPTATMTVDPMGTMQPTAQTGETGEQGFVYLTLAELTDNPSQYYGQRVSVEGDVAELVNVRSFVLSEGATLGSDQILVVNMGSEPFPLALTADVRVQVIGTIRQFTSSNNAGGNTGGNTGDAGGTPVATMDAGNTGAMQGGDLDLSEVPLREYGEFTVLVIDNPQAINFIGDLGAIAGDPQTYAGQTLSVRGVVGDVVSPEAFVLRQGGGIGDNQVLVVNTSGQQMSFATDQEVWVYGTVSSFDADRFRQEYGLNLDPNVFQEYQDYTVLLAESVTTR